MTNNIEISDSGLFYVVEFVLHAMDDRAPSDITFTQRTLKMCVAHVSGETLLPLPNQMTVDGNIPLPNIIMEPKIACANLKPGMVYFIDEEMKFTEMGPKDQIIKGTQAL